MVVRGKFVVSQVTRYESGSAATVVLEPRYDSKLPEDQRFAEATPSGRLEMVVTRPSVVDFFVPGKVFYLDFTEAPEGTPKFHQ